MSERRDYVDPYLPVEGLKVMHEQGQIWLAQIPEYMAWLNMMHRCYSLSNTYYKDYGGRGIRVYEPWQKDFWEFFQFMGRRPVIGMSLYRINNDKGYFPGNCRWATQSEQCYNCRPELCKYEGHPSARLTWEKVRFAREHCEELTAWEIAKIIGVSSGHVSDIIRNRYWYDKDWSPPPNLHDRHSAERHWSVISPKQAGWAKHLLAEGYHPNAIAHRLGISEHIVRHVKRGAWPHVEPSSDGLPENPKRRY